jgi:acyl-coenzyme A thioesterase 13
MAGENPDQLLVRRFMQAPDAPLPIDTNPVAADLAMVLQIWDPAARSLTVGFTASQRHMQGNGTVHGGVISTMLDLALVFPVLGALELPKVAVTVSLNIHFEKPVLPGQLIAVARIDQLGGRLAFATAELRRAEGGGVLARATAAMAVLG